MAPIMDHKTLRILKRYTKLRAEDLAKRMGEMVIIQQVEPIRIAVSVKCLDKD